MSHYLLVVVTHLLVVVTQPEVGTVIHINGVRQMSTTNCTVDLDKHKLGLGTP